MARTTRRPFALLTVAVLAIVTGCGSSDSASGDDSGGTTLQIGTVTGALPYQGLDDDGETVIGYEPDLIREAAKRIDAEVEFTILDFDALFPGVDSGRFDLVMSGFSDKPERQEKYDMLDVANDKFTFAARPEMAESIKTPADVCGRSTGAVAGGAYVTLFEKWDQECKSAGKDGFTVRTFDGDSQGFLAVKSGQTDFWPSSVPIIKEWASKNDGGMTSLTFMENPSAFVLPKGSDLTPKLQEAIQSMVDDGTYAEILKKWKVEAIARDQITVNAGKDVTK